MSDKDNSELVVPPIVAAAVSIGLNYAIGRFILFPLLIAGVLVVGFLFGDTAGAIALAAIPVGCVVWIIVACVSTVEAAFAPSPEERVDTILEDSRKEAKSNWSSVDRARKVCWVSRQMLCSCGGPPLDWYDRLTRTKPTGHFYSRTWDASGNPIWKCAYCHRETPRQS